MYLWKNNGDGTFTDVSGAEGITDNRQGRGLLTFDYDNDGDLDVFETNNSATPVLYRNNTIGTLGSANDWLKIDTVGQISTRDGLGAIIMVDPDSTVIGDELIRNVMAGSHFLASSDITIHFGLGNLPDDMIDLIQIWWPSGIHRQYFSVAANQQLTFFEIPEPSATSLIAIAIAWIATRRRRP
jgi:hypothetical protein